MIVLPRPLRLWIFCVFLTALLSSVGETRLPAQTSASFVPIVGDELLLGGVRNGKWMPEEKARGLVKGGEKYRFYTLAGFAHEAVGGKPKVAEAGGSGYYVPFPKRASSESTDDKVQIGVAGTWNPLPRKPRLEDTNQKVYLDAVAAILKEKGLPNAKPHIRKIARVDLEGKGTDSVIIDAASPDDYGNENYLSQKANSYSFILLRTVVQGKVKSSVLSGAFYTKNPTEGTGKGSVWNVQHYRLAAILDLNGDGVLEIITSEGYYEGWGITVYRVTNGSAKVALQNGDGV